MEHEKREGLNPIEDNHRPVLILVSNGDNNNLGGGLAWNWRLVVEDFGQALKHKANKFSIRNLSRFLKLGE